ncbi:MAG: 2-oxoacid:ferredoxin oxidoreductase subunit beta [Anaerolineales bacterium]
MATTVETRKAKVNTVGLAKADYKGRPSTLCAGCGHNSISSQIINAAYDLSLSPHEIIKLSGIGCSSKSPAYFLGRSHGFNSLHGRMPSLATGALVANRSLKAIGVSGDGDTASIGMGQFIHLVRRNVPMVYIIENNGVYGLTKGQFSATSDHEQTLKYAGTNPFMPVDLCMEALTANGGFVARSFAGDPKQVRELIKAALSFEGTAVLDIISPCVTFNDRDESTKSYSWGREHEDPLHDVTYVPRYEDIEVDYEAGETTEVRLHDGSALVLKKLDEQYDPTDRSAAIRILEQARANQVLATGLIYFNADKASLQDSEQMIERPLSELTADELRPSLQSLQEVLNGFK